MRLGKYGEQCHVDDGELRAMKIIFIYEAVCAENAEFSKVGDDKLNTYGISHRI